MAITSEMNSSNVNITSSPIFFRTRKYFDLQCSNGSQEYVWQEAFLRHCHQKETFCAPLLADLFLYSYENEFLDNMIRSGHRRLARSLNLCYRYIDDLFFF